jgi:hypothetical protein
MALGILHKRAGRDSIFVFNEQARSRSCPVGTPRKRSRCLIGAGFAITAFANWNFNRIDLLADYRTILIDRMLQGLGFALLSCRPANSPTRCSHRRRIRVWDSHTTCRCTHESKTQTQYADDAQTMARIFNKISVPQERGRFTNRPCSQRDPEILASRRFGARLR